MPFKSISIKRIKIDKSNSRTVVVLAICSFLVIFSMVASRAILNQRSYQSRVIGEKKKALVQLRANNEAANQLVSAYQVFNESAVNIIGGSKDGTADKDGDNAKIVLDALPSKYDFPALATSLEKIITDQNYKVDSINGTDDELNQATQTDPTQPIEIPFQVTVSGGFDTMQGVLDVFQRSIRPIQILQLNITGGGSNALQMNISAKSYYQPEKKVNITTKVIQ